VPKRRIDLEIQDWSDQAASAIAGHAAHIAIDVVYDHRATRATAVGAALRAHAALMEFAPVVGVWWDEGMRLLPAADMAAQADAVEVDPAAAPAACISRRRFELDGANTGLVMFDTLGLRAFGLPDGQVVAPLAEAAAAAAAAGEIAAHLFERGCDVPDGAVHALADGSTWHVAYRRSAFAPDREVIQLRLAEGGEAPNPAN